MNVEKVIFSQGTHGTGKTGKWRIHLCKKKRDICQDVLCTHHGANFLILNMKDNCDFVVKMSICFFATDRVGEDNYL